jgi:hypothetical protein
MSFERKQIEFRSTSIEFDVVGDKLSETSLHKLCASYPKFGLVVEGQAGVLRGTPADRAKSAAGIVHTRFHFFCKVHPGIFVNRASVTGSCSPSKALLYSGQFGETRG